MKNAFHFWAKWWWVSRKSTLTHLSSALTRHKMKEANINIIIPTLNYIMYNDIHPPPHPPSSAPHPLQSNDLKLNVNNMFSKCPRPHERAQTETGNKHFLLKPRGSSLQRCSVDLTSNAFNHCTRCGIFFFFFFTLHHKWWKILFLERSSCTCTLFSGSADSTCDLCLCEGTPVGFVKETDVEESETRGRGDPQGTWTPSNRKDSHPQPEQRKKKKSPQIFPSLPKWQFVCKLLRHPTLPPLHHLFSPPKSTWAPSGRAYSLSLSLIFSFNSEWFITPKCCDIYLPRDV